MPAGSYTMRCMPVCGTATWQHKYGPSGRPPTNPSQLPSCLPAGQHRKASLMMQHAEEPYADPPRGLAVRRFH